MSAASTPALERTKRVTSRYPVSVPLDVIALRSGVPENLPGRCIDLSESGVGGMIAGELAIGQHVAVELRLPHVGVPVRARALVRYQGPLRCGFEFVGLPVDQREIIRYWSYRAQDATPLTTAAPLTAPKVESTVDTAPVAPKAVALKVEKRHNFPQIKLGKRGLIVLLLSMAALTGIGWWQWQRSWKELEVSAQAATSQDTPMRVAPETMEMRILSKTDPIYPDAARREGKQGVALLDAVIAADGTVSRLQPISGDDLLAKSAADAVQTWRFEPYQSSGHAVAVETTIAIEFRLN